MTTAPAVQTSPREGQSPANEVVSYSYEFMIQVEECFSNEFEKQDCYDAFGTHDTPSVAVSTSFVTTIPGCPSPSAACATG